MGERKVRQCAPALHHRRQYRSPHASLSTAPPWLGTSNRRGRHCAPTLDPACQERVRQAYAEIGTVKHTAQRLGISKDSVRKVVRG